MTDKIHELVYFKFTYNSQYISDNQDKVYDHHTYSFLSVRKRNNSKYYVFQDIQHIGITYSKLK